MSGRSASQGRPAPRTPRPDPAPDGLLVLDKPEGPTSHDVVSRCRWLCATRKVGHAGTLDPMATGVLLVGVGRATRLLTHLVGADKTYSATIRLGEGTTTEDAQGEFTATPGVPDREVLLAGGPALQDAVASLTGEVQQVPSAVSALKVDGKRAHAKVRDGEEFELAPRPVTVYSFEVLDRRPSTGASGTETLDLDVRVRVSSGTYVRALARDLGRALGSEGHLVALRREAVGGFTLDLAAPLQELVEVREGGGLPAHLPVVPMGEVARRVLPVGRLDDAAVARVRNGMQVTPAAEPAWEGDPSRALTVDQAGRAALLDEAGELVAVATRAGERWQPTTVFPPATGAGS
ncbi:tRNA pseudouridine(55) synthase TruB [Kytococcus schroeteri]|uniref:tRNA pseudouridine synthase B n=1 Tax=Kytococcus schroeteri TaxID=138300 RepID=A0A2I1PBA7_9MICO|nr:tRNA pseudouridine(55) synthase TruB [Kytococcus schroeteri]PKZ41919.1 tRNA pseudouridine(55) synthase TruB [Kytococcus schroeteri]